MKHETSRSHDIELDEDEVAYIKLPIFFAGKKIVKNVHLHELITGYKGCDIIFDFTADGEMIGIEILT